MSDMEKKEEKLGNISIADGVVASIAGIAAIEVEGVAKLKERLEAHNAELTYKLYESHHYQYIPEMLIEYLKEMYPCS